MENKQLILFIQILTCGSYDLEYAGDDAIITGYGYEGIKVPKSELKLLADSLNDIFE